MSDIKGGDFTIPQLNSDPASPASEDAWVRKSGGGAGAGSSIGMLLGITYASGGPTVYEFSYRTKEGTTVRVELT